MRITARDPRVNASEGAYRYQSKHVELHPSHSRAEWVSFSPDQARAVARLLKKHADFLDPPKKRGQK